MIMKLICSSRYANLTNALKRKEEYEAHVAAQAVCKHTKMLSMQVDESLIPTYADNPSILKIDKC